MFCDENCEINLETPNFHYEICAMLQEKNIVSDLKFLMQYNFEKCCDIQIVSE